jgi:hypothetical protein
MKSFFYTTILVVFSSLTTFGQIYTGPIPKPTSGYGSDGSHTVGIVSFANPNYPSKNIEIYYPSDIATKVPTIFYSHAFGGNNSANISGMLNFVAMKGYAIVYVPYQTTGVTIYDRYDNLLNGFRKAARDYPAIIDTTKVGFLGHSFGGGASFGNAYKCFTQNNWGQNGRFIYALAQWYSYNISQTELQSFPANTKLLTEIFDDDVTNDHRMAIDIYNNINISSTEKDFILLKSDTIASYIYLADHVVPNTSSAFDALDYYAYYRLLDALCDYTFNGNLAGKNVALGNGSVAQVTMPTGLKNLVQTDNPLVVYPESKYTYPCSDIQNLRSSYCSSVLGVEEITYSENSLLLFPNPALNSVTVILPKQNSINELKFYNSFGQLMLSKQTLNQTSLSIDLSSFTKGIYFITLGELKTKLLIE